MANPEHVEILKCGVEVWNQWRTDHPEEAPQLQGAVLTGLDLRGANLRGAELRAANLSTSDLRYAFLTDAKGLQPRQLAGADLGGAEVSEAALGLERLVTIEEASRNARKLFLSMLLVCAYSLLTLATTKDAGLLTATSAPIVGGQVAIVAFYWFIPFPLLVLYVYCHIYLQYLWEALAAMPAVFPDGRTLDEAAYPWLLSGLVNSHVPRLKDHRPPLHWLKNWMSVISAWMVVPLTLVGLWLRYLTRQDLAGTSWHVLSTALSVFFMVVFYRLASRTLRLGERRSPARSSTSRHDDAFPDVLLWLSAAALFWLVSIAATSGVFPGFGVDFRGEDVSTKPSYWTSDVEFLRLVKGANLRGRNLRSARAEKAFLAKADLSTADLGFADLREADLRRANLSGAALNYADLRGADLNETTGLTQEQLSMANGDIATKLPDDLRFGYVLVPAGTFEMGCAEGDDECSGDEEPHPVEISRDFWIGRTEVTVAEYRHFVAETNLEMPRAPSFNPNWTEPDHPIVDVTWDDAKTYCEWAGGRLPTEAE